MKVEVYVNGSKLIEKVKGFRGQYAKQWSEIYCSFEFVENLFDAKLSVDINQLYTGIDGKKTVKLIGKQTKVKVV